VLGSYNWDFEDIGDFDG